MADATPTQAVAIPSKAVAEQGDVLAPARKLLEGLNLLGSGDDTKAADGPGALVGGPPQSVALIEAGATAAAKWWSAGLGAAVIGAWGALRLWYTDQAVGVQIAALGAAGIVTAALVVAIGYLLASDIRGRAAAAVATTEARARVALEMLDKAESVYARPPEPFPNELIALPGPLDVHNHSRIADDEPGWKAVALERQPDGSLAYVVVKGSAQQVLPASQLTF